MLNQITGLSNYESSTRSVFHKETLIAAFFFCRERDQ